MFAREMVTVPGSGDSRRDAGAAIRQPLPGRVDALFSPFRLLGQHPHPRQYDRQRAFRLRASLLAGVKFD